MNFQDLLNYEILGNTALRWLIALVVAVLVFILLRIIRRIFRGRINRLAQRSAVYFDDLITGLLSTTRSFFFFGLALYVGSTLLEFDEGVSRLINQGITLLLLAQAALWGNYAIRRSIEYYSSREDSSSSTRTTLSAINFIARLVLFSLLILFALDNLGINITTLVAGLGVTSIAVALAVQNILGDLFSSLSIVIDKPFEIGDFIVIGEFSGTVENIGLRSTRLRSLSGEQLVFANNDMMVSRIRNYKRMQERRIAFTLGVTYDTPTEKLKMIPEIIKNAIENQGSTRFDRSHFSTFADFSLNFETVYYMLKPDYALYMDTQQAINLELLERFGEEGIEFAFPTQTLYLQGNLLQSPASSLQA